jgi:hypothetical protein
LEIDNAIVAAYPATIKRLGKIIGIGLVSLIVLEVGLRICSLFPGNTPFYVSDPGVGFRVRPNVSVAGNKTNSQGFNDIDHEKGTSKNDVRIAVISDSFVFGAVPRKANFVPVIEGLAERASANIEVWNMGIPAAGPENYLHLIKQDAVSTKATLVCVVFFIGNDITQSHPDFKIRIFFGAPREILRSPYLVRFSPDYFYVYRLFRAGTRLLLHYLARLSQGESGTFARETYLSIEYQRSAIYKVMQDSEVAESYSSANEILKQMALEAAENKMGFVVVLAPDEVQVNPLLRQQLIQRYGLDPREYDFGQPQKLLMEYLRSRGIKAFDLLPDFSRAGKTKVLYLSHDSHWNEQGNKLAAQEIWLYLSAAVLQKN